MIFDLKTEVPEHLKDRLKNGIGKSRILQVDVFDRDSLISAEEIIRKDFGIVDTLINTAGGNKPDATTNAHRLFFDLLDEAIRKVVDLNFMGTFLPCQNFGRGMVEIGRGAILNISSLNAFRPLSKG